MLETADCLASDAGDLGQTIDRQPAQKANALEVAPNAAGIALGTSHNQQSILDFTPSQEGNARHTLQTPPQMSVSLDKVGTGHKSLGILVRERRVQLGLTQEELGNISGLSRIGVMNIESGPDDVKLSTLERLAVALQLELTDLLCAGVAPIGPLIDRFLASDYGRDAAPTDEEIAWLRSLPSIGWRGREPNEKTIDRLLEALRSSKAAQK